MKFFNNLKIFHRIMLAFISILLVFIVFNFYIVDQIKILTSLTRTIHEHPLNVSNASLAANRGVIKIHRSMKDVVLSDNDEELQSAINEVNADEKDVYKELDIVKKRIIGKEGELLQKKVRKLFKDWKPIREEVISLTKQNRKNEAEEITKGKGLQHVKLLEKKMTELNQYARNKSNLFIENTEKTERSVMKTIIVAMFVAIVLSILIAMFITLSITREIDPLRDAMITSVGSGKLKRVSFDGNNEITDMAESYNLLVDELNLQNWYRDGLNKLTNELLLEKETLKISEKGLSFICQYGGFHFGAICKYLEQNNDCQLIAQYGLEKERGFFKSEHHKCLMVQTAIEREEKLLRRSELKDKAAELNLEPYDYFFIPLMFESTLLGVMAIGSKEAFTSIQFQFIKTASEILGSSLSSALKKENLQLLMQELQVKEELLMQQNEELQAKEEELMQQNEELVVKEEILIQQNEEINSSFKQLSISEEKYRSLFNNMNECVVMFKIVYGDDDKPINVKYLDVNHYYEEKTGRKKEFIIGKTFTEVFNTDSVFMFDELIEVERTGQPVSKEIYFAHAGIDIYMSAFSPAKDIIVLLYTDISDRKKSEEILRSVNIELKKANMHKNKFLSTMSHELRTPLNAILGFSETLQKKYFGELNEKQEEYISLINNSGQHLLILINDILDISKIDAGTMDLYVEKVACCDLIENITSLLKPQYIKKGVTLNINHNSQPCFLQADKQKIKQVMLNLLSNAIKYTPEGGNVDILVEKYKESFVKFSITDTGVGIKEEDIDKIFTEFYQTDHTRDQALGGSGIGLALCKRLVEMHDGEIFVESVPDQGSTFTFILPEYHDEIE